MKPSNQASAQSVLIRTPPAFRDTHPGMGEEALATGIALALHRDDVAPLPWTGFLTFRYLPRPKRMLSLVAMVHPLDDPIKEACQPTDAPPPQWMTDKNLLPKKPPQVKREAVR